VTEKRTGPVTFVKQSISELRKVVWPTGSQLTQYFVVVLIFVMFMIALVSVLDFAFGWALLKALG
jgi:preprotein translocase subunit SecE